jgi:hypothetical protein
MMSNEPTDRKVSKMTPQQAADMLKATTDHLKANDLWVNIAIVVVEAGGYYTVGNMPEDMMETVFQLYLARAKLGNQIGDTKIVDERTGEIHTEH